jgi:hypothetical protein
MKITIDQKFVIVISPLSDFVELPLLSSVCLKVPLICLLFYVFSSVPLNSLLPSVTHNTGNMSTHKWVIMALVEVETVDNCKDQIESGPFRFVLTPLPTFLFTLPLPGPVPCLTNQINKFLSLFLGLSSLYIINANVDPIWSQIGAPFD